jgi:ribosome-associated toxin RatA of RatAB toxin-antitoxin module
VRDVVLAFAQYAQFMPHYLSSKVLGRTRTGGRDVYMEVEAMSGAIKFWAEMELPAKPVTGTDGVELYETKFIKGNVNAFDAAWRLRKIDAATTELTLEVYLEPKLMLPGGALNHENLKGSAEGVVAMKARAEQGKR